VYKDDAPEQRQIAGPVVQAVLTFLRPGVRVIEQACNQRRLSVLGYLRAIPAGRTLPEWGLPNITVEVALCEASPEFVLVDPPDPLRIQLTPVPDSLNPDAPMTYRTDGVIFVHMPRLAAISNRAIPLFAWHEMLHACGETRYDGVVRYNKIGVDAVVRVVTGGCPDVKDPPCSTL
jgi:hypothetical protein